MPLRVALGLREHALRAERELLGLDDCMYALVIAQSIIRRSVRSIELFNSGRAIR